MSFITTYKKLCECNLYHHYFLDDGTTAFDDNATLKTEQLAKYDFLDYASILPSEETARRLRGQKIHFRITYCFNNPCVHSILRFCIRQELHSLLFIRKFLFG